MSPSPDRGIKWPTVPSAIAHDRRGYDRGLSDASRDPTSGALLREKEYWNERQDDFERARRWINRAIGEFDRSRDIDQYYDPRGKVVLDYGCGPGFLSERLIARGATHVTGIDISEKQIAEATARAARGGFADRTRFLVTDAHDTGFPSESFDLVVGSAILHHLDLERALRELRRVLRPGGRAVFNEPLWHNPVLRAGRRLTPSARTVDEHPLTERDWALCASIFPGFRHYERELLSVPLMPVNLVLPRAWQRRLVRRVLALDEKVMRRWPALRKYARMTILVLE